MELKHVVVDGSNIATEGRSLPSLKQLDEAVRAFLAENPTEHVTVIVDATFGHRIDAVRARRVRGGHPRRRAHHPTGRRHRPGRQVRPADRRPRRRRHPLQRLLPGVPRRVHVALRRGSPHRRQAGARRRLGLPAAHAGAGPGQPAVGARGQSAGRRAPRAGGDSGREPARAAGGARRVDDAPSVDAAVKRRRRRAAATHRSHPINDPLPFIEFVANHPVGSHVDGEVERFASHGAYVASGRAPVATSGSSSWATPRRAARKDVLRVGETRTFAVHGFDTPRRGIDLALVVTATSRPSVEEAPRPMRTGRRATDGSRPRRTRKRSAAATATTQDRSDDVAAATGDVASRADEREDASRDSSVVEEGKDVDSTPDAATARVAVAKAPTTSSSTATNSAVDNAQEAPVTPVKKAVAEKPRPRRRRWPREPQPRRRPLPRRRRPFARPQRGRRRPEGSRQEGCSKEGHGQEGTRQAGDRQEGDGQEGGREEGTPPSRPPPSARPPRRPPRSRHPPSGRPPSGPPPRRRRPSRRPRSARWPSGLRPARRPHAPPRFAGPPRPRHRPSGRWPSGLRSAAATIAHTTGARDRGPLLRVRAPCPRIGNLGPMSAQFIYTMHKVGRFHPPDREVLKDISLSFYPGAKIGVIGANGSGKSSLLRIMAGLDDGYTGEARLTPGFTVGLLEQEPQLDPAKDVSGNVMDGVGETATLLERYDAVLAELGRSRRRLREARRAAGRARGQDRGRRRLGPQAHHRDRHGRAAPPAGRRRRHDAVGRRAAPCGAVPAAAVPARPAAARRAHQPPRRRVGGVARAVPADYARHGRGHHPRPLLPRQRRPAGSSSSTTARASPSRATTRAGSSRSRSGCARRSKLDAKRQRTLERELEWVRMAPKARQAKGKARLSAYEQLLSEANADGGPGRQARDLHPVGQPPGRRRDRGRRTCRKGFGDQLLIDDLTLHPAPGRHRRRHRPQRRRQDHAVPDDHRRREARRRRARVGPDGRAGLRRPVPRRRSTPTARSSRRSPTATRSSSSARGR